VKGEEGDLQDVFEDVVRTLLEDAVVDVGSFGCEPGYIVEPGAEGKDPLFQVPLKRLEVLNGLGQALPLDGIGDEYGGGATDAARAVDEAPPPTTVFTPAVAGRKGRAHEATPPRQLFCGGASFVRPGSVLEPRVRVRALLRATERRGARCGGICGCVVFWEAFQSPSVGVDLALGEKLFEDPAADRFSARAGFEDERHVFEVRVVVVPQDPDLRVVNDTVESAWDCRQGVHLPWHRGHVASCFRGTKTTEKW
jgi:hypothetical protein